MSRQSSQQAALSHPRGNSHWTGANDSRYDSLTGCKHALTGAILGGQTDDAGHGGTLETEPCTSLRVGKGHALVTGAGCSQRRHNGERNRNSTSPPEDPIKRSRTPSRAACRTHVLRGGSQRNESPTARSSWPSDSTESRCLPPEIRKTG